MRDDTSVLGPPAGGEDERGLLLRLKDVYGACAERGYDPVRQVAYFLATGEPAYITAWRGARTAVGRIDRYAALESLVRLVFGPESTGALTAGRIGRAARRRGRKKRAAER